MAKSVLSVYMRQIHYIQSEIADLRSQLNNHKLYDYLNTLEDVKVFMENHAFAVWDFMSLLKALQAHFTCLNVPWVPASNPKLARFINEIVLAEESDVDVFGKSKSHFEMYMDAMVQIGADTNKINQFLEFISIGKSVEFALKAANVSKGVTDFVLFTFSVVQTNEPHVIASAFTFGRENLIPDIFIEILKKSGKQKDYNKFSYYLERHIELDGNDHGPTSLEMIADLCGKDVRKWLEVLTVARKSLEKRILLWDEITNLIQNQN
ncbi:DUF3050 domain-containing protein [Polaribacter sp. R77954]|uniref:DUF3050 domain-containing protein n=1 Tax=Polaribacter sp. R77954 TaxID=3093870 RepID=UPI0037C79925